METIKAVSPTVSGNYYLRLRFSAALSYISRHEGGIHGSEETQLYLIDMKYIRNLAKADDLVMSVSIKLWQQSSLVGVSRIRMLL